MQLLDRRLHLWQSQISHGGSGVQHLSRLAKVALFHMVLSPLSSSIVRVVCTCRFRCSGECGSVTISVVIGITRCSCIDLLCVSITVDVRDIGVSRGPVRS